jgi:hypothetical protein
MSEERGVRARTHDLKISGSQNYSAQTFRAYGQLQSRRLLLIIYLDGRQVGSSE